MKKSLIAIFALILSVNLSAQNVDEVVNKHIEAVGGKEKWDNLKSLKISGNIEIMPQVKAPFVMYMKDRNKMRFELEVQGMKIISALDVDSGWKIVPFTGKTDPERMSPEEIKDSKKQADYTGDLYDYKKKGNQVEYIGTEDMEGTETHKLKITKEGGDVVYTYLDADSYLILKETSKFKLEEKEHESTTMMSNYQDIDGIKFPFSMEVRADAEAATGQAMTVEKVEINPVIDDKIFEMPPMASAVQPAPGDGK